MAQKALNTFVTPLAADHGGLALEGKLKGAYRLLEKALRCMSGPIDELETQWSMEKSNDCARASVQFASMLHTADCIAHLRRSHVQGDIKLLQVKDRYSKPTGGGWSDFVVIFKFTSGAGANVPCELQIVHEKLMVARKGLKAHAAYDSFRAACEMLEMAATLGTSVPPTTKAASMGNTAKIEMLQQEVDHLKHFRGGKRQFSERLESIPHIPEGGGADDAQFDARFQAGKAHARCAVAAAASGDEPERPHLDEAIRSFKAALDSGGVTTERRMAARECVACCFLRRGENRLANLTLNVDEAEGALHDF